MTKASNIKPYYILSDRGRVPHYPHGCGRIRMLEGYATWHCVTGTHLPFFSHYNLLYIYARLFTFRLAFAFTLEIGG